MNTTAQRIVATYTRHGINSALLTQLQHVHELALCLNLTGRHLVGLDMTGYSTGSQVLEVVAKHQGDGWRGDRLFKHQVTIPNAESSEEERHEAHAGLANLAADLMALLEEDEA